MISGMTYLENWCFACIACTFGALLCYVLILIKMELEKRQKISESKIFGSIKSQENPRDFVTESVLFSLTAGGFVLFNVWFWVRLI